MHSHVEIQSCLCSTVTVRAVTGFAAAEIWTQVPDIIPEALQTMLQVLTAQMSASQTAPDRQLGHWRHEISSVSLTN